VNESFQPLELFGQQQTLYEALIDKDERLARMYLGSLRVLSDNQNPDRLALVAHGLRELMEKLPRYLNVPIKTKSSFALKAEVHNLRQSWNNIKNYQDLPGKNRWRGQINKTLRTFLVKVGDFFVRFEQARPTKHIEIAQLLQSLEIQKQNLPSNIEEINIQEWKNSYDYFTGVSHHRKTTLQELEEYLNTLEEFLLDRLRPRTFEDYAIIDNIIKEGEEDAEF
jgi:hypothetical protein